jgi:hypothetical protein
MMKKLLGQFIARRATDRASIELHEATGQVCAPACRSAAHRDRIRTAAFTARF